MLEDVLWKTYRRDRIQKGKNTRQERGERCTNTILTSDLDSNQRLLKTLLQKYIQEKEIWQSDRLIRLEENVCVHAKSLQSCPILCAPMDCSPTGSSVHGILLARMLEWVALSSSRGSSQPRDKTHIYCGSCIAGGYFTTEPPREDLKGKYSFIYRKLI